MSSSIGLSNVRALLLRGYSCLVLGCAPLPGLAQPDLAAGLLKCRGVVDLSARLACFDALAGTVAPPREASAAAAGGAAGSAAAVTGGTRPPTVVPAPAPDPEFGLPARPSPAPQAVTSAISGRFEGWLAGEKIRLDNGQVWEVIDGSSASYRLNNPRVRVVRGMLGAFFLEIEGVSQTPRVRRVQ